MQLQKHCAGPSSGFSSKKAVQQRSGLVRGLEAVSKAKPASSMTQSGSSTPSALPSIMSKVKTVLGKDAPSTTKDMYIGMSHAVRESLIDQFNKTHAHWEVRYMQIGRGKLSLGRDERYQHPTIDQL